MLRASPHQTDRLGHLDRAHEIEADAVVGGRAKARRRDRKREGAWSVRDAGYMPSARLERVCSSPGGLARSSPLPGRDRVGIAPQAASGRLRFTLGTLIAPSLRRTLLLSIVPVPPRHAGLDLDEVLVLPVQEYRAHLAPVLVTPGAVGGDLPAEDPVGEVLARDHAEGLLFLRRMDSGQTEFVLLQIGVEDGDCVAVADTDDPAGEGGGGGGEADHQQKRGEQPGDGT